jgi:hypothetical protein
MQFRRPNMRPHNASGVTTCGSSRIRIIFVLATLAGTLLVAAPVAPGFAQTQSAGASGLHSVIRSIAQNVPSAFRPSANQASCVEYFINNHTYAETTCESISNVPHAGPQFASSSKDKQSVTSRPTSLLSSQKFSVIGDAGNQGRSVTPDTSYSQTLNCDDSNSNPAYHCWAGYSYTDSNEPYAEAIGDSMLVPGTPSSSYSTPFSAFWLGLYSCSGGCEESTTYLVQSGIMYGNHAVTGESSSNPVMFEEVVAPITISGVDCTTGFCGKTHSVSVGDNVTFDTEEASGEWDMSVYDSTSAVDQLYQVSTSTFGFSSLEFVVSTFEGFELTSSSQVPSVPAYGYGVSIFDAAHPLSNMALTLADWSDYDAPTSTTGITFYVYVTSGYNSYLDNFEWNT